MRDKVVARSSLELNESTLECDLSIVRREWKKGRHEKNNKKYSHIHILLEFQSALHFAMQFTFEVTNERAVKLQKIEILEKKVCICACYFCRAQKKYKSVWNLPLSDFLRNEQTCTFSLPHYFFLLVVVVSQSIFHDCIIGIILLLILFRECHTEHFKSLGMSS